MTRPVLLVALAAVLCAAPSTAHADRGRDGGGGGGGRPEVRAGGACSGRAASSLRLRGRDGAVRLEFGGHGGRRGGLWGVAGGRGGPGARRGRAPARAPPRS